MKNLVTYLNEANQKQIKTEQTGSWVAIDIVTPDTNSEDKTKTKQSYRVVTYDTFMDMKKNGCTSNGVKVVSVNAIGPSCPSKEKAQEYIKKKK